MSAEKEHKLLSHRFPEQVFDYLKSTHQQIFQRGKERLSRDKKTSRKIFYIDLQGCFTLANQLPRSLSSKIDSLRVYSQTITQGRRLD
ncbi:hypothetical protein EUGRSUZ_K02216 [Eucalyptus grandis]|uniref:Uncharacterized protein n=2 Tax=Eucalyptus grandis TaxID=71139 RepID=A0ACC3IVW4_EUCGR|nr:hypothetical protein EUGRSUZ_K02216 [Eucalyptus grandis]